jgi:hypothetical protein
VHFALLLLPAVGEQTRHVYIKKTYSIKKKKNQEHALKKKKCILLYSGR